MLGGSGLAGGGTGTSHVGFRRCFLCVYLASHSWWSVTRRSSLLYRDVLPIVRMDTGLKSFDTKGLMQSGRRPILDPRKGICNVRFHWFMAYNCSCQDIETLHKHHLPYLTSCGSRGGAEGNRDETPVYYCKLRLENMFLPGWGHQEFLSCRSPQRRKNWSSLTKVYTYIRLSRCPRLQPGWKCENATFFSPACYLQKNVTAVDWGKWRPAALSPSSPALVGEMGL